MRPAPLAAFLHRQLYNAPLDLEAHQALVRFNIAGNRELIGRRRLLHQARVVVNAGGNSGSQHNTNWDESFHSFKPREGNFGCGSLRCAAR
jgi:hypothetical protein